MMGNGEVETEKEGFSSQGSRQYQPVAAHDRPEVELFAVPERSSTTANSEDSIKRIKVSPDRSEGTNGRDQGPSSPSNEIFDRTGMESKLELFGFDSLVNILGLRSMAGQQVQTPSSPEEGENVSITLGRPKKKDVKLGTLMGVFVPCLQNILGIIFYIRFSWIVGIAGIGQTLILVSLCCLCTFLTGISLSAIATNGAMKRLDRPTGPKHKFSNLLITAICDDRSNVKNTTLFVFVFAWACLWGITNVLKTLILFRWFDLCGILNIFCDFGE